MVGCQWLHTTTGLVTYTGTALVAMETAAHGRRCRSFVHIWMVLGCWFSCVEAWSCARSLQVSAGKVTRFLAVGGAEFGCAIDVKALGLYYKRSRRARSSEQQSVASVSLKAHVWRSLWCSSILGRSAKQELLCASAVKFKGFDRPPCLDPKIFLARMGGVNKVIFGQKNSPPL